MRIVIISGSHRKKSESARVADYISSELKSNRVENEIVSLAANPLPLWDEGVWSESAEWQQSWYPIAEKLQAASGFVVVSPEWSGMVPPGLKNFFLLCGVEEVAHKPALIVSVSSGIGGTYPVAELRSSSYKNNRIVYLPEHVIVRDVGNVLQSAEPAGDRDSETRKRISYGLRLLTEYSKALGLVRESGVVDHSEFPYGL